MLKELLKERRGHLWVFWICKDSDDNAMSNMRWLGSSQMASKMKAQQKKYQLHLSFHLTCSKLAPASSVALWRKCCNICEMKPWSYGTLNVECNLRWKLDENQMNSVVVRKTQSQGLRSWAALSIGQADLPSIWNATVPCPRSPRSPPSQPESW